MRIYFNNLFVNSAIIFFCAFSSGCTRGPFHAAASLRVEIEVYKGPLSKQPEVQYSELVDLIDEVYNSLRTLNDTILVTAGYEGFLIGDSHSLLSTEAPEFSTFENGIQQNYVIDSLNKNLKVNDSKIFCNEPRIQQKMHHILTLDTYFDCLSMAQIRSNILELLVIIAETRKEKLDDPSTLFVKSNAINEAKKLKFIRFVIKASKVAARLRDKAFYWAEASVPSAPGRIMRVTLANFTNLTSQYSNHIGSRADALLKQMYTAREELPTSIYLRDSNPTDFLNLYAWNRAVAPPEWEEILSNPFTAFTSEETTDRIRVVERLFADRNWSKINTVYASGQGDVRIALIKDDIGNWNLKSFDNDPKELLDAYRKLTEASVKSVIDIIQDGFTGGSVSALKTALSTASHLTSGNIAQNNKTSGQLDVENLHKKIKKQLFELKESARISDQNLSDEKAVEENALKMASTDKEKNLAINNLKTLEKTKKDTIKKIIDHTKQIINDYSIEIRVLQESIVND